MWTQLKRTAQAPMRLLGILNQIRILLEEQNDLLREIHLATRGSHALTPKRRPADPLSPFQRQTTKVWNRPQLTERLAAEREMAEREEAASSVSAAPPNPDATEPPSADGLKHTADAVSGPLGGWPA